MADIEDTGDDVRRRTTFTPPPEGAEFPERLGELTEDDIAKAKQASEAASAASVNPSSPLPSPEQASYFPQTPFDPPSPPQPATPDDADPHLATNDETPHEDAAAKEPADREPPSSGPRIPPAPVRTSLDDQQIMAQFSGGDAASTEALMKALESQLDLREQEDQRFSTWASDIRALLPEGEAEALISKSRREFDGLAPLPEPEVKQEVTPETVREVVKEVVTSDSIDDVSKLGGESDTGVDEGQLVNPLLAEFARDTSEIPAPVTDDNQSDRDYPVEPSPSGFDTVLSDPDASSPPTASWPLISERSPAAAESAAESEPEEAAEAETESAVAVDPAPEQESETAVPEEEAEEDIILPTLVQSGISVGTETVTIREVVATREIPEEPFVGVVVEKERWFSFDRTGIEPAPELNRTSRALSIFWTWWSVAFPLGGFLVGAWLTGLGLSFVQAIIAAVAGVVVGAIPLVVGTLQGVRTGLPALVVSRLTFGTVANVFPASLLVLIRFAVAAFFLWAGVWVVSGVYVEANLWQGERALLDVIGLIVGVIVVGALAMVGRHWVSLVLWVAGGLSLLATAAGVVLTWELPTRGALSGSGSAVAEVFAGVAFVAAIMMILWAQAAPDIARFVSPGSGVSHAVVAGFAAVIPPVVLVGWGALLGASDGVGGALLADPFDVIFAGAPAWYPLPAVVLMALPLFALAALSLHSSSYQVMSLGFVLPRYVAAAIGVVVVAAIAFGVVIVLGDPSPYLVDVVWLVGVVVSAFVGAVVADWLTRRHHPDHKVLLHPSSGYPRVRIAPLAGFAVSIAAGWGFVLGQTPGFEWLGYLVRFVDSLGIVELSSYQLGVFVALVLSATTTALAGIRGGARPQVDRAAS